MHKSYGDKEKDEFIADLIGSIIFATLIILYCVIRG